MEKKWFHILYFLFAVFLSLAILSVVVLKKKYGLTVDIESDARSFQVYYDTGEGFNEEESIRSTNHLFTLPDKIIKRIRIDPFTLDSTHFISIRSITISRSNGYKLIISGIDFQKFLNPQKQISLVEIDQVSQTAKLKVAGDDPILILNTDEKILQQKTTPLKFYQKVCSSSNYFLILILLIFNTFLWFIRKKIFLLFERINKYIDEPNDDHPAQSANKPHQSAFSKIIDPFTSMKTYWFLFFLFALIYILSYSNAYVRIITLAPHDSGLFFNLARNIAGFNWLGNYHSLTLAKVPGYPLFLAFCILTRIPYLLLISICNTVAVAFFLRCTMWVFNRAKLLSFLLGMILLLNPIFADNLIINRGQLTSICFTVFLGVIIAAFNPATQRKSGVIKLFEAFVAAIAFGVLIYTREERILYYGILVLSGIAFFIVRKQIKYKRRNLFLPLCGLLGILVIGLSISSLNYLYYGRFVVCERTSPPFTKAINAFHSVDDPDLNPRFSKLTASRTKIHKIAELSPNFRKVAEIMCDSSNLMFHNLYYFDKEELTFKQIEGKNIPISHFEWFWIACVNQAGLYKDAKTVTKFHEELDERITKALKDGTLKKRQAILSFGPYSLGKEELSTILKILPHNYKLLLPLPAQFYKEYKDFLVQPVSPTSKKENLKTWSNILNIKYLNVDDQTKIMKARHSINNFLWNIVVILFAYIVIPLIHLATPLALLTIILALLRKQWLPAMLILIVTLSYVIHFILLAIVDVTVGFGASSMVYFLPSYAAILINAFISIRFLLSFATENKLPNLAIQP
jgi:hypothetical protein